jgi:hypothetical protein
MKFNIVYLFLIALSLTGCGNLNDATSDASLNDSLEKQRLINEQMAMGVSPEEADLPRTQAEERKLFIETYDDIQTIDTALVVGGDSLKFHLKYYCLRDSVIIVPKQYQMDMAPPKPFKSHPFVTDITLVNNGDTVLNRQFKMSDFNPFFQDNFVGNLKKYGSILDVPKFSKRNSNKDQIVLIYSLAIPVTDIGIGMYLIMDKTGKYKIVENF